MECEPLSWTVNSTNETALAAAKQVFEDAGLQVAVCGDFLGRIIDRLVRPYYNAALRRLDEGLVRDQRRVDQRRVSPPQQVGIECAVARSPDA